MTEKERILILMTWMRYKCEDCGVECVGEPDHVSPGIRYLWCPACRIKAVGTYDVLSRRKRYTLPLPEESDHSDEGCK